MIRLQSVRLDHFKGVAALSCAFDDFTLLVGLNNSGKTTVLQAANLLVAGAPLAVSNQYADNPTAAVRTVDLSGPMASMGFPSVDALLPAGVPRGNCRIMADFTGGFRLELRPQQAMQFAFTLASTTDEPLDALLTRLRAVQAWPGSEFVLPPGTVATREDMLPGPEYRSALTLGKGAQLWRNGFWWSVQNDGPESFAAVQQRIARQFPDVQLLLPTLGDQSRPPDILLRYREHGGPALDIAQSGSGLRTFLTLSRLLDQSAAQILLLDEPDAHLHASQQAATIDLLMDAADSGRQVVVASHAPEFIARVPRAMIRWLEPGRDTPVDEHTVALLERLGTSPYLYATSALPDVLVLVEGGRDLKPIEALIGWVRRWCGENAQPIPASPRVVEHRYGRFEEPTLRGICSVLRSTHPNTRVVGIRDLDWDYDTRPEADGTVAEGDGYMLLTLGCKEMENLFCDPDFLAAAVSAPDATERIRTVLDEESAAPELVDEWRWQVLPGVRDRLPRDLDKATRESQGSATFAQWTADPLVRRRLVAGKTLLRRMRERLKREDIRLPSAPRTFESVPRLTKPWHALAHAIFPAIQLPPPLDPPAER